MCVEESVHIIFDETNFLTSEQETNNFKIALVNHKHALKDSKWIVAMQEQLNEFERNKVWHLELKPKHKKVIGLKWVFKNKLDEHGIIVRNKAKLVVKGYNQQE